MQPAVVIGVDAPPIGSVPTLSGTPARTAAMIWSVCARVVVERQRRHDLQEVRLLDQLPRGRRGSPPPSR